tara:strand:- start:3227 stop:3859 length:633 start_codon:yes stop_codon:yes gene_type:complete
MSSKKDGIIIILSSPSGAGKTTLVKKISTLKNYKISISYTTRPPRTNEINGKDYVFISKNKFKKLINERELLEHAKVFNNYYGSSKKKVFQILSKGKNVLFDIDWQGTEKIKRRKLKYKLITFFILPPSKKVLFKRLSNRDMKDKFIVGNRMKQFDNDVKKWRNYDFVVINDNLNTCYKKIVKYINAFISKRKIKYNKKQILKHIKNLTK